MQQIHPSTDMGPQAQPHEFDDVLGTCGELGLMLGRLRREHLLPEGEYAVCQRQLSALYDQLTARQQRWLMRSMNLRNVS